jgi:hypothetical protein
MMSGVPLETCRDFKKLWNNKFYYKAASCWYFYWACRSFLCWTVNSAVHSLTYSLTQYTHKQLVQLSSLKGMHCSSYFWFVLYGSIWIFRSAVTLSSSVLVCVVTVFSMTDCHAYKSGFCYITFRLPLATINSGRPMCNEQPNAKPHAR